MSFCRSCGNPLGEGESFCGACGQPVNHVGAEAPPAAAQPPAPEAAYTPPAPEAAYAPPAPVYTPPAPVHTPPAVAGTYPPPATQQAYAAPPPPTYPPAAYPPASQYGTGQPYGAGQPPYGQPAYAGPQPGRSNKGLWIGLGSALLVIVIACVLVFVVFRDDIFHGGGTTSDTVVGKTSTTVYDQGGSTTTGGGTTASGGTGNGGVSAKSSPSAIMAAATNAIGTAKSTVGTFDLKVTIKADTSKLPADQAKMLADPWTLSGTVAYAGENQAGDFGVKIGLMGQTMDVGLKLLGDKAWIGLGGQWYESSADTESQLANSGIKTKMDDIQKLVSGLSIDPISWLKDQADVKEETINGTKVLHLSGSNPDWAKVMGDIAKITASPDFQSLMSSAGSTVSSLESQLPSADQLQQMQSQLDGMFKNVKIDVWVEKDTSLMRKITIVCDVVPQAAGTSTSEASSSVQGCDLSGCNLADSGITSINLNATITLDPNKPVDVKAPSSPKPYEDLQKDIQANPGLLGPFGSLLSGVGAGN